MSRAFLHHSQSAAPTALSQGVYRKDVIRQGRFIARNPIDNSDLELHVTPDRISRWVAAFDRMQAAGVKVDLTVDHQQGAAAKRGEILGMRVEGDRLMVDAKPADSEGETLMLRCPEVSVEIDPEIRDGEGRNYGEGITAVSIVRKPVVPGQQPWAKIAASRDGIPTLAPVYHLADSKAHGPADLPSEAGNTNPPGNTKMTPEQIAKLKQLLGLDPAVADADAVLAACQGMCDKCNSQSVELSRTKAELSRVQAPKLESPEIAAMRRDLVETAAESVAGKIDGLVTSALVKPATAEILKLSLLGNTESRPVVLLSRDASTGKIPAMVTLGLIEQAAKEAVELASIKGERSGSQSATAPAHMSRGANDDANITKAMIESANAGSAAFVL